MSLLLTLFVALSLSSCFFVVTTNQSVYAALFLVLSFFNTALVLLTLGLDFLALAIAIIYIGSIMVLFLFIIQMLSIKISRFYSYAKYSYLAPFIIALLWYAEKLEAIENNESYFNWFYLLEHKSSLSVFYLLSTHYLCYLFLTGFLLLVAMLSSLSVTKPASSEASPMFKFL
jgi:NADH-quinone oxidoreductase subunit J